MVWTAAGTPPALIASWRSKSARLLAGLSTVPVTKTPALLTRISRHFNVRAVSSTAAATACSRPWTRMDLLVSTDTGLT